MVDHSAAYHTGVADAIAVCVGLRRACLLEGGAALRAAAVLRAAACICASFCCRRDFDSIRLVSIGGSVFIIDIQSLVTAGASVAANASSPSFLVIAINRHNARRESLSLAANPAYIATVCRDLARAASAIEASTRASECGLASLPAPAGDSIFVGGGGDGSDVRVRSDEWVISSQRYRKRSARSAAPRVPAASGCPASCALRSILSVPARDVDGSACLVTLAGWLLGYPSLYNTCIVMSDDASAKACISSGGDGVGTCLDGGEPLLLCRAICRIPLRGAPCAATQALLEDAGAGSLLYSERKECAAGTRLSAVISAGISFSIPVARCAASRVDVAASAARALACDDECSHGALCALLPAHAHICVHNWMRVLRADVDALNDRTAMAAGAALAHGGTASENACGSDSAPCASVDFLFELVEPSSRLRVVV